MIRNHSTYYWTCVVCGYRWLSWERPKGCPKCNAAHKRHIKEIVESLK